MMGLVKTAVLMLVCLRETDVVEKQRDCSSDCEARFDAEVSLGAGEIRLREDALENVLERTCAD